MTSPVPPSDHLAPRSAPPAARYAVPRHAACLGAAAVITDEVGRVLLVRPTYHEDGSWLLPGGVVEVGEHPLVTCRREIAEELGLTDLPLGGILAVYSLSPGRSDAQPGALFPGEIRFVFDAGTLTPDQVKAIRLPPQELADFAFLETRDAVQRMRSVDGQIMLAAYRARLGNTATAHLADGLHILDVPALDRHDVHVRYRPLWDSPLNLGPVPDHLPVQQAWGWCFVPDGRVVLVADPGPRGALPMLPGGTVESTDTTPEATFHREAAEEAQLTLTDPVRLGWVLDETGKVYGGVGPNARLRLAARVTGIGPAAIDPATGHAFIRLLTTPAQAAALLGWGQPGARQAQLASQTARERWGLPPARPVAIEEIPTEGMRLS
ncbi:NUDIX domain-containing protein [Streptomyces sp. NPDC021224]|uniref:NUDIX hydrolase n=1 Tax=unclassified Streptomyces TaxID=2593676 RepID=UPI0037B3B651